MVKSSSEFIHDRETVWQEVAPGVSRKIVGYDDKIMMVKVMFSAGGVGVMHDHFHSQVTYVVSGKFRMTIGDDVREIQGGDSFYVPPFVTHGCVCIEDGMLIDVFSPAREDFLTA